MEGGFSINHQFGHTVREQSVFEFVLLWHENVSDAFRVIFFYLLLIPVCATCPEVVIPY